MKYILVIIFMLLPSLALADEWTAKDTTKEVLVATSLTLDWVQTRQIAKQPERWHENNFILGRHPHIDRVNAYFASAIIGHAVVAYVLPEPYRTVWQAGWFYVEVDVVNRNKSLGLQYKW